MSVFGSGTSVRTKDKDGKERIHPISPMGPSIRAHYVRLMKEKAWAELDRQRTLVDEARWGRMEETVTRDMMAGRYDWADEMQLRQSNTRTGFVLELLARLLPANPDADTDTVEELVNAVGWERLGKLMQAADGPPPKDSGPESNPNAGPDTPTPNSSRPSSTGTPASGPPTSSP